MNSIDGLCSGRAAWWPVIEGLLFPEGPAVRADTVACVDVQAGAVHFVENGEGRVIHTGGSPNGAAFDDSDNLLVADSGLDAILAVRASDGAVETLWDRDLEGPNDLIAEGRAVTFTDPGDSGTDKRTGRVLCLTPEGVEVLAEGLAFPNGLVRTEDGSLLVTETKTGSILKLDERKPRVVSRGLRNPDGSGGPDGLCILPGGEIIAAVYGAGYLAVLGRDYRRRKLVSAPGQRPTNVCHDGRWLYCTEVETGTLWRCPLSNVSTEAT